MLTTTTAKSGTATMARHLTRNLHPTTKTGLRAGESITSKAKKSILPEKTKTISPEKALGKNLKKIPQMQNSTAPLNTKYTVGMHVEHERFGTGKIISIDGTADNTKAIVLFDKDGQKQLLLKYAKLKII